MHTHAASQDLFYGLNGAAVTIPLYQRPIPAHIDYLLPHRGEASLCDVGDLSADL